MSTKLTSLTLLTIILCAGCAARDPSRSGNPKLMGEVAQPAADTPTSVITASTRYVNVMAGQAVRFVVGDQSFTWSFNNARYAAPVDLRTIAPPGFVDRQVIIYVWNNPAYLGGG